MKDTKRYTRVAICCVAVLATGLVLSCSDDVGPYRKILSVPAPVTHSSPTTNSPNLRSEG